MCLSNSESYNILVFYLYYLFILVSYLIYCFTFLLIGYIVLYYVWCGRGRLDEGIFSNRFGPRRRARLLISSGPSTMIITRKLKPRKWPAREVNTFLKTRDMPLGPEDWSLWKEVCQFKPWWFEDAISTWLQMWWLG